MVLSKDVPIDYALRMAKLYYPKDKYDHAIRVMQYVADNELIPDEDRENCLVLAIMHDLLEDTDYKIPDSLNSVFVEALQLLTKPKDKDYIEYIKNIRNESYESISGELAYWVKIADMKDHLAQTETLTDKLKEKYLKALPYLL